LILRRVGYRDQETGKCFEFLTNHMTLPAGIVADICKEPGQVEIFFQFIKHNLKIKSFLGNSKNAVLSQVYVTLIAYRLLAYQKFLSKIGERTNWPGWYNETCFSNVNSLISLSYRGKTKTQSFYLVTSTSLAGRK
jgi:hypothetical protein